MNIQIANPRLHVVLATLLAVSTLALGLAMFAAPVIAADAQQAKVPEAAGTTTDFNVLLGQWVRPDGGYIITIQSADSHGKLNAAYMNPAQLPFAQAKASLNDTVIDVFLELRAGGYNGSTYNLTYDPENDILWGVYYQAVAQQKFDVYFARIK